ncbi:hypothetical protein Y1Q_0018014 [Alligator mississippiensis]|uniref:Uncharacterized protein n=1 Tax=Alligator mississippiensis TaxID=8496 RepID=A0A151MXW3_ALLMI|nr:hypothetical protein Y1Q_0018014 [Alligator mississippiensis]
MAPRQQWEVLEAAAVTAITALQIYWCGYYLLPREGNPASPFTKDFQNWVLSGSSLDRESVVFSKAILQAEYYPQ